MRIVATFQCETCTDRLEAAGPSFPDMALVDLAGVSVPGRIRFLCLNGAAQFLPGALYEVGFLRLQRGRPEPPVNPSPLPLPAPLSG